MKTDLLKKFLIFLIFCIYAVIAFQIYDVFLKDNLKLPKRIKFPKNAQVYSYTSDVFPIHKYHRVVVFAAFSSTGKISEYVVYYLKELKKVSDLIVFIADNPIISEEAEKIKDLVYHMEFEKHGEYDFGSYKRGLNYLRQHNLLDNEDSLVLANDSCYGGVYPFGPIFTEMKTTSVDFWGMSSNSQYQYHLQSYFLVFSPKILSGSDLDDFLNKVKKRKKTLDVVLNYEVPLTAYLNSLGYTSASYVPDIIDTSYSKNINNNKTFYPYTLISKYNFPLIKRKVFFQDDVFTYYLRERPHKVMTFLKKVNPELHQIILSEYQKKY